MTALLRQLVFRYLLRHPFLSVLDVAGVAIGVAAFVAIQASNGSALQAFAKGLDLTTGRSHLEVREAGGAVPEPWYPELSRHPDIEAATPVVEGYVTVAESATAYLHVVGVDAFSSGPFATVGDRVGDVPGLDLERWLGRPGELIVHERFAREHGLAQGAALEVDRDGRRETVRIAGVLPARVLGPDASPSLAIMDVGWAREWFGGDGLTSIQLRLRDPSRLEEAAASLRQTLGVGAIVEPPRTRSRQMQRMMEGFRLNLSALSMVSALVGVFLIYNTVSASVVRRRREIGILRACGASPRQVFLVFLAEGAGLGLPGVLVGLPLGLWLGQAIGAAVSATVSAHYFLVDVARVTVAPGTILVAATYGMGASLAGAWWPAREAAGIPPLDALRPPQPQGTRIRDAIRWLLRGLGSLVLSAGASWMALGPGPAGWSFAACFLWVTGFALATPWAARRLVRFLGRLLVWRERWVVARIAVERFDRSLHRSAVTVAALMASLAMMIGVATMVSSFRGTVSDWVNEAMRADEFVTPAGNNVVGWQHFLPERFLEKAQGHPAVARIETYRQALVRGEDGDTFVLAAVGNPGFEGMRFLGGNSVAKIRTWGVPGTAFATEPLARRMRLREGDKVRVPTPSGVMTVTVRGIYRDYSDDRGKLVVPRDVFAGWWGEDRVHSVAFTWIPGTDVDQVRNELGEGWRLSWMSNTDLRRRVFEVFDQTFAVTQGLRGVAVLVAILGVSLALSILVLERTREIGILRATGASPGQIRRMEWIEAAVIGLAGSGLGILCGLGMSVLLIRVVNPAFFGWTIDLAVPWAEVLSVPLWIVPVSMAAAAVPAFRAGRIPVAAAVRAE